MPLCCCNHLRVDIDTRNLDSGSMEGLRKQSTSCPDVQQGLDIPSLKA
jgi:hypothetical protein